MHQVSFANDKDRTLNNCKQARLLFNHETVDSVVSCVAGKHKETIIKLGLNLSDLLRIVFCTSKLDFIKLNEILTKTMILIARDLKWDSINYTLHGLLPHLV